MIADEQLYFDYFTALFARSQETRLTLDITPGYALLSAGPAGVHPVVVRAARRARGRGVPPARPRGADLVAGADAEAASPGEQPGHRGGAGRGSGTPSRRTPSGPATRRPCRNLDESFGALAHFAFYEELFDPASAASEIARLTGFLGIDHREPDLDARFNVSPRSAELPEATVREVAEHFRPTYEFVASRFPDRDLSRIWPSSRFVL